MDKHNEEKVPVDPRTALLLLVMANVVTFTQESIYVEWALIAVLFAFMGYCGCFKAAVKLIVVYAICLFFLYFLFDKASPVLRTAFVVLFVYARKIMPCLMVGTVIVKRIPMHYMVLAMRKWHFPQKLIIALSVTIRYFPAIHCESCHIKDAMRLRGVKGAARFESFVVPLMMSAVGTAEELSAAAVTRGVENPVRKTSAIDIKFAYLDYIALATAAVFVAAALVV